MKVIDKLCKLIPTHRRKVFNDDLAKFPVVLIERFDSDIVFLFVNDKNDLKMGDNGMHVMQVFGAVCSIHIGSADYEGALEPTFYNTSDIPQLELEPVRISDLNKLAALSTSTSLDSVMDAFWDELPFDENDLNNPVELYVLRNEDVFRAELILDYAVNHDGKHSSKVYRVLYCGKAIAYVTAGGRWCDEFTSYSIDRDRYLEFLEFLKRELNGSVKPLELASMEDDSEATFLSREMHFLLENNIQGL